MKGIFPIRIKRYGSFLMFCHKGGQERAKDFLLMGVKILKVLTDFPE